MTKTNISGSMAHRRILRFSIGLLALLFLSILPSQDSMAAKADGSVLTGVCGKHSTWKYNKNTKVLTISGKGAVSLNRKGSASPKEDIRPKRLVVKQGITSITYYITDKEEGFRLLWLKKVSLPDSLRAIQGPWFIDCNLASLTIPKNVNRLDAIPFLNSRIKKLRIHPDNKHFVLDKDGILFTKDKKKLVYYPLTAKAKTYRVPESVTRIGDMAFFVNPYLRKVVLTKHIQRIGNGAFACCRNLKKINLQITKVRQLQDYNGKQYGLHRRWMSHSYPRDGAFEKEGGEDKDTPEGIYDLDTEIYGGYSEKERKYIVSDNENYFGTFQGTSLESFVMPDTLRYAGKQTLYLMTIDFELYSDDTGYWSSQRGFNDGKSWVEKQLKKIVIGKNFRGEINGGKSGSYARKKTLDLHYGSYPAKTIQVHPKNKKYKVKNHVLYSKNMDTLYAASDTVPKKLTVSAKTHYIARGAFCCNSTLRSIKLKGRIYRIGQSAFERCFRLKNVTFLKAVDRIERSAFSRTTHKMVLKGGIIRYIGEEAFYLSAAKMNFDSSQLRYIGEMAFYNSYLKSLKLNGSLRVIGENAFVESELQNLQIHSTTDLIVHQLAFQSCCKLKQVSITSDKKLTLQREVFKRTKVGTVTLSKGAVIHRSGLRIPTEEYPGQPDIVWK